MNVKIDISRKFRIESSTPLFIRLIIIFTGSVTFIRGFSSLLQYIVNIYNIDNILINNTHLLFHNIFDTFGIENFYGWNLHGYDDILYTLFGMILLYFGFAKSSSYLEFNDGKFTAVWRYPFWSLSKIYSKEEISDAHIAQSSGDSGIHSYRLVVRFVDNRIFDSNDYPSIADVERIKLQFEELANFQDR